MANQHDGAEFPIDSSSPEGPSVGEQFLAEMRWRFEHDAWKIRRCLEQLNDDELDWRPNDASNSVATIIVHLCGSTMQWMSALGGRQHERDRPAEFAADRSVGRQELRCLLDSTLKDSLEKLSDLEPARLQDSIVIQGFTNSYLTALYCVERHQAEHIGQIAYIVKLKRGSAFESLWIPENKEQAASPYGYGFHAPGIE